ncbi:MAG: helix-turn-helix domain-containing protein [Dysosmobacter welbionis]
MPGGGGADLCVHPEPLCPAYHAGGAQPSGGTEQIRPGPGLCQGQGVTPYRYLMAVRISEARRLLERGVSSAEAAVETGFSDQSHFTNYFCLHRPDAGGQPGAVPAGMGERMTQPWRRILHGATWRPC